MKTKITFLIMVLAITMNLFAGAVTIPIAVGITAANLQTAMSDAVTAGNADITFQFADGYVLGTSASGGDVTLVVPAGVTKLTFYAPSSVTNKPTLNLNTLTFTDGLMTGGIVFEGVKLFTGTTNRYLIQPNAVATNMPAKLTINNCWIEGYRAVLNSTLATTTDVVFTNNYFKNIAASGIISVTTGSLPKVNIRNNTFNNVGGTVSNGSANTDYFIDFRSANSVSSQINFSNNTIYFPTFQGRGLFRLGSGTFTTGYIKENNNIYSTGNATSFALQLLYTNSAGAISDADSTNYYSNKMTLGINKGSILTTVYTENTPSNLFLNPGADDFTINDANFAGKSIAGDPRWFPASLVNPRTITTTVSPVNSGTVTPTSVTVSSGSSTTLTATRGFGFTFKEWRGAVSNNVVSTVNPLSVTATTDTALVAVFDPVTTYNFSVTNDGTGATWGQVTLNPLPNNGKYEAGTTVTATLVPNGVSTFVKWDDNTSTSPRVVTVNSDIALTATFDVIPFVCGWDFKVGNPNTARVGDYYTDAANKGLLNIYNQDNSVTSWLANTGSFSPSTPCSYLWTTGATFATNRRYWQATFSTLGYTNVQVNSLMAGAYQHYLTQKMQVSLNGVDYTDLASANVSTSTWTALNGTLPQTYENQATVYVKWIANTTSTLVGNAVDNDGTAITNIFVYGTKTATGLNNTNKLNAYAASNHNSQIQINSKLKNGKATIYSLMGQKLEELLLTNASMLSKKLTTGVYLVQFEEAGMKFTQKVIIK